MAAIAPALDPGQGSTVTGRPPVRSEGGLDLSRAVGWLLSVVGFVVGARTIADNSFLTHLATGHLILERGSVPTADPYSALAAGSPWTIQSWLVSVIYGILDATVGGWAIRLFHGAVAAAVTAGLWRLLSVIRPLIVRVASIGVVVLIGASLWSPRPLLVGVLALVLTIQVVAGLRAPWLLVPIFWLWVNAHGSFVLGCVLLAAVAVGAAVDGRGWPRAELGLVGWGAVGCLAAMIGPLSWQLLWFPVELMGRRDALDGVAEWTSPTFRTPTEQLYLLLLVVIAVAAARGARWRALVPALLFFVAGLLAVRNLGLASVVIVGLLAPALAGLPGSIDGSLRGLGPRLIAGSALAGLAVALVGVVLGPPIEVGAYPTEEVTWLEERSLVATEGVLLGQRDFVGNYLDLRYGAEANIYMDDRFDFHPLAVIDDHRRLLLGGDYDEIVARSGFDVVLWERDTPFRRWLDRAPDWRVVLDGDDWFVACRTTSPHYDRCRP